MIRITAAQKNALNEFFKEHPDAVIVGFGHWKDLSEEERSRAIERSREKAEMSDAENGN